MTSHTDLRFDFNYLLSEQLGSDTGLTVDAIEALIPTGTEIQTALQDLRKLGQLPFLELPYHESDAKRITEEGQRIYEEFDDIVLLGIGGSALGPACLHEFLTAPPHAPLAKPQRRPPRLFVIDNVDPWIWQKLADQLRLEKTLFIVISKSGKTVETLAAFAYFREKLICQVGENKYQDNFVIITDPDTGPLREIAREEKILNFSIPPGIGGRFSVLSSVGLFPAACVGLDIPALLAGARRMDERAQTADLWLNPPYLSAMFHYLYMTQKKKLIRTLMPYAESLETFSEWYCQLWAESLGKRQNLSGEPIFAGSTPVRAMGATDQHSQLQLYLDGPEDKIITFFTFAHLASETIPVSYPQYPEFKGFQEKSIHELLDIEYRATERALRNRGIPSMTCQLPQADATSLGGLLYFAELETVITGELFNINPFDQPAVEAIKKYIKGMLGMSGFEEQRKEIEGSPKNERYII